MLFRLAALDQAKKWVGVKEHPAGSNRGPQIDQWQKRTNGATGYPWCAAFLFCMFDDVGLNLKRVGLRLPSFVQDWVRWARERGYVVERPLKGDVVCFDWDSDRVRDHIGIVDKVLALRWRNKKFVGYIRTIEGNTAVGNDSNGGQVMVRWRWVNSATVFVRVPGK